MQTTTAKHTPGPWKVMERDSVGDNIFSDTTPIRRIANTYGSTEAYEANARLIAAAPELLEALEGWLVIFGRPGAYVSPLVATAIKETEAAIAKARGE